MPVENQLLRFGGLEFDLDIAGPAAAPLVLLLHGFPQSKYAWRHELEVLARAGYRAAAPNQRGYSPGARPPALKDYGTDRLVDDVFGFADALGAARFHLVGHDWGGMLAWLAAARAPERLYSLSVLSRPHPDAFARALRETDHQAERSRHHKAFLDPEMAAKLLADDGRRLRGLMADWKLPPDAVEAYFATLGTIDALNAALNWYRAVAGNLTARGDGKPAGLGPITVPTLYVWGDADATVGPEAARWTGDHVAAPYRFVPLAGVGHFITDESPRALEAPLKAHLADFDGT